MTDTKETLSKTPLYDLHVEYGGRMVPFAGYEMPVQYNDMGIMKEHLHTRAAAGIFDVSHMGQIFIDGADGFDPAQDLERIIPSDLKNLGIGKMRYTVLLNNDGGIIDDLIVTRVSADRLFLVVNASRKSEDITALKGALSDQARLLQLSDRALIAIQGPKSARVLSSIIPKTDDMSFMEWDRFDYDGTEVFISRSGYTGEDGFEISIPGDMASDFTIKLLESEDTALIGLGARDSLRLEAGLCLYGNDLNEDITPIEASLGWVIQKSRRTSQDFTAADEILRQITDGPSKKRIGLKPEGRAPIREGVALFTTDGTPIGHVTSGGFGPSVQHPVAMGYVTCEYAKPGQKIVAKLRGKDLIVEIVKMPFLRLDKTAL